MVESDSYFNVFKKGNNSDHENDRDISLIHSAHNAYILEYLVADLKFE